MSIGTVNFHPSAIEDHIYDILDSDPDFIISSDTYTKEAVDAVEEYFSTLPHIQWDWITSLHPDMEGGSASIAWIESGHLHHIVIDYRNC